MLLLTSDFSALVDDDEVDLIKIDLYDFSPFNWSLHLDAARVDDGDEGDIDGDEDGEGDDLTIESLDIEGNLFVTWYLQSGKSG